jgi:hypothetical protein
VRSAELGGDGLGDTRIVDSEGNGESSFIDAGPPAESGLARSSRRSAARNLKMTGSIATILEAT